MDKRPVLTISPILAKALDRLVSDVLTTDSTPSEALARSRDLAKRHGIASEYLEGWLWGHLVGLARSGASPKRLGYKAPSLARGNSRQERTSDQSIAFSHRRRAAAQKAPSIQK